MKNHLMGFVLALLCSGSQAQPDPAFDDLLLNGLAHFEQLREEYYIGALYMESITTDANAIREAQGRRRMEIRITTDRWPPRRFSQQWNQAILLNADQAELEEFTDQILQFNDIPEDDLVAGDTIQIDADASSTTIYLNGKTKFRVANAAFFNVLLNAWIGNRPPSTDFKADIVTLPTDKAGTELLLRYEAIQPDAARQKVTAGWSAGESSTAAVAVVAAAPSTASSVAKSPISTTEVTAKAGGSSAAAPKPKFEAAPKAELEKPAVTLDKPTISSGIAAPTVPAAAAPTPAPAPAPAPTPTPTPEPKAAPAAAAVAAAPAVDSAAETKRKEQEALLRNYRSNVMKLTYLNTQYPKRAMDLKQEGLVVLKVKVNRKGKLVDLVEAATTDHELLNKAARTAVKKSTPYPEVPAQLEGEEFELSLPFNFKI